MLRMVLVGLLIPLGVGILAAIELKTPPPAAVAVVRPPATTGISVSHDALTKPDQLEIPDTTSATRTWPALVDERISPSEVTGSSEAPSMINRHRHALKSKKVTAAALLRSKPRTADIKRSSIPKRPKTVSNAPLCRLDAFGGLRKALNLAGCEI
jgi:hypothetical protein